MVDALRRISEECLSNEEAEKVLQAVPIVPGDDTVFKVFKEKEEDRQLEKIAPHTMSSEAMKAIFDDLTSGASRRTEQEYSTDSALIEKPTPFR